ncbi:sporulation histidine kinase inhibitor Sda [Metabacillus sediminilitoris]
MGEGIYLSLESIAAHHAIFIGFNVLTCFEEERVRMIRISNDLLILSYMKAKELKLDSTFISLLKVEIQNRKLISIQ